MDKDFLKDLDRLIEAAKFAEDAVIEEAVEKALQEGKHGVLVIRDPMFRLVSADLNPMVPYGTIYVMTEYDDGTLPASKEGNR